MKIEIGEKPPPPKKESNQAKPILFYTPEKAKQAFDVIRVDEEDSFSLDAIWMIFCRWKSFFLVDVTPTYFFGSIL